VFALGCLVVASTQARLPLAALPDPPQVEFKDLFVAVQTSRLFGDGKAFPDSVPQAPPADILEKYHSESPRSPDALKQFVEAHFALPADAQTPPSPPEHVPIVTHIDQLWDVLTRRTSSVPPYASLLPLPEPYVVPGGRFREIYYWDSYFTMLGLEQSGRQRLVEDMVRDFAHLLDTYGHIPNGARTYYLSRSQPPFFFAMVALLSESDPGAAFARFLPQLRREHAFWMEGSGRLAPGTGHRRVVDMPDGAILNRYWDDRDTARDESYDNDLKLARESHRDPSQLFRDVRAACESGWDFSSRWFDDAHTRSTVVTTEIIPVDLNSLMFGLENAIRLGCERQGDQACAKEFSRRAATRRAAMDRYLWDGAAGVYLDYRWTRQARVPRISAASLYPLFVGAASDAQATSLEKAVARDLLKNGGLVTTTLDTGQQWDAPNGWAPLQWVAISGLRQYGKLPLAEAIACRWMANVNRVYADTGKLVEKYDVVAIRKGGGGEYPLQDGFGWTNGVMRRLVALYPADATFSTMEQCPKT
jgi:alpha,alpha-trehalase